MIRTKLISFKKYCSLVFSSEYLLLIFLPMHFMNIKLVVPILTMNAVQGLNKIDFIPFKMLAYCLNKL